jgi:superfamily II DNA or RNA helicase
MSDLPVVILKNRLYIPKELVTDADLNAFTYTLTDYASQEPVIVRTYKPFANLYGFARGDMGKIQKLFGSRFEIQDERAMVPHGYQLKFTGKLRAEQERIWVKWLESKYGLVKCPPRWGKTIFMTYALTKLRQRAIVLAHESGILQQFEDAVRKFTNINELEEEHGVKLCGQLKKYEDVFPIITFSTWQMFNQPNAAAALKANRNAFGLMFIDEAHACAAPCFSKVVSNFNPQYRLPVTATDKRKDGFDVVVSDIAGPVVAVGTTEQLPVLITVIWTKYEVKHFADWNGLWNQLVKNEPRNQLIARQVVQDVADGHSCVVFTDRRQHAYELKKKIVEANPELEYEIDILIGGSPKTEIRDRARSGECKIVIASPKIVQLGWDVPRWSAIHNTLPMANEQNWYQRLSRVRTPCEGCPGPGEPGCLEKGTCQKLRPVARIYADLGNKVTFSCLAVMNRVHTKLDFEIKHIKPPRLNPVGTTRAKKWSEMG